MKINDYNCPSDHIPVAGQIGGIRILTWNVLNKHWWKWFDTPENKQLVARNPVMYLNTMGTKMKEINGRELIILKAIQEYLTRFDVICLQEVSSDMLYKLTLLDKNRSVLCRKEIEKDMQVIMYNKTKLQYLSGEVLSYGPEKNTQIILSCNFNAGNNLNIVCTHAIYGMTDVLFDIIGNKDELVICGDLNSDWFKTDMINVNKKLTHINAGEKGCKFIQFDYILYRGKLETKSIDDGIFDSNSTLLAELDKKNK